MYVKKNLMLWVAKCALALPLMFIAGNASAAATLDGAAHTASQASGWSLPSMVTPTTNPGTNTATICLGCHQPGGASDKSAYLSGGHKNMSRKADGQTWGMPGVNATNPAVPELSNAGLNPDGSFSGLWIQEDYPRMTPAWTIAFPYGAVAPSMGGVSVSAASSISVAYCSKVTNTTQAIGTDDVPALSVCPDCESPVMGNGNAGYPLGYKDSATCAAAAVATGNTYAWVDLGVQPLSWIYGGAGLEGGPAMMQASSQNYKCGRCHTTGWKAATAVQTTMQPAVDAGGNFTVGTMGSARADGSNTKILNPSFGASAYANVSAGTITSITMVAKGSLYPMPVSLNCADNTKAPSVVIIDKLGGTGSGATAHAVMAAATTNFCKVNSIVVDTPGSNYQSPTVYIKTDNGAYGYSAWDDFGIQCSRCHAGSTNHSVASAFPTGGDVVSLCMNCHRQESDIQPRSVQGGNGFAGNNGSVLPYTNKQQQPDGFAHHPDGNEFLNSPHAMFTGNWADIGCPPYTITESDPGNPGAPLSCTPGTMNLNGSTTSKYASKFAQAAKVDLGLSDSVAGSCTTCHDVHKPHNENTSGMGGDSALKYTCQDCHSRVGGSTITPQVDITKLNHPTGPGTPFAAENPCEICHQPAGAKHLWRINTDANYSMYGNYTYAYPVNGAKAQSISSAATDANYVNNAPGLVNLSNFAADGTYANAMWVDVDNACGQCHGGGVSMSDVVTTGSITKGSTDGSHINALTVADAKGFASGKEVMIAGAGYAGAAFKTIIAKVDTVNKLVYLTYPAVTTVTNAVVTVAGNPTANGAPYFTKAALAAGAAQMHNVGYVPPTGTTPVVSHGTVTQTGYAVSFTDSSTDNGDTNHSDAVTVNWGDGTTDTGIRGGIFSHTFTGRARIVSIVHMVRNSVDSNLYAKEVLKLTVPVRYNVAGTVFQSNGTTAITSATVVLRVNNHTRQMVKSDATTGAFTFTNVLPGSYTIHVYKSGVTFGADVPVTVTTGNVAQNVTSVTP